MKTFTTAQIIRKTSPLQPHPRQKKAIRRQKRISASEEVPSLPLHVHPQRNLVASQT